ncbi:hypothetical protein, partial [Streptococcus pneumoniae]|uniref:hypothetical protein n=1 Tax=Streptococcus pneumoniae TaxID=1313 RepID=UPI001E382D1A
IVSDRTPLFTWNEATNAHIYDVYVSEKSTPKIALLRAEAGGTSKIFPTLLQNGDYTFWVRGKNGSTLGAWSAPVNFTINTAATSTITS